jgi:hypothetical protein
VAAFVLACLTAAPGLALAQREEGAAPTSAKREFEGITPESVQELHRTYGGPLGGTGRGGPLAVPDIFGHGAVLTVGKVVQKVTNFGFNGNPFTNTSSDPSGQWPGQSGTEYLFALTIAVGGVNPSISAGDPVSRRRVSSGIEWRPPSLAPEDRIYAAYEGIVNGKRFDNDDGDRDPAEVLTYLQSKVDEDFLDGWDNDGDGRVDEDFGALGQQMYSLVMRDDTEEAIRFTQAEPHVPVGFEIRERAWAYSLQALENFNVFEYQIKNITNHEIDSVYVAFAIDADAGPVIVSNYFIDDLDIPQFPSGHFTLKLPDVSNNQEPRLQKDHDDDITAISFKPETGLDPIPVAPTEPLCTQLDIRVNGFSFADDNGDEGKTLGIPSLLLFDHTLDPLGVNGPPRVGFRAFRSYGGGEPYTQGGPPRIDQQRFEFMSGRAGGDTSEEPVENIDPETGFINYPGGDQKGDFAAWASIGPWLHLQPGASITVTMGFAIQRSKTDNPYAEAQRYSADYAAMKGDSASFPLNYMNNQSILFSNYPGLKNAYDAQVAFEGVYEARRDGLPSTDWHGRETPIRGARGSQRIPMQDCRDQQDFDARFRDVIPEQYTWFDFDCNYCTGVWNYAAAPRREDGSVDPELAWQGGMFHKTWNASAPPPGPGLNTGTGYNFTDNPTRTVAAPGDRKITLAWDNGSQLASDPGEIRGVKGVFDFRGYSIYKVAGWTRPVGSPGPAESEWALVASFTSFDYRDPQGRVLENNAIGWTGPNGTGDLIFPKVLYPGREDSSTVELHHGDLWDRQSGTILSPDRSLPCVPWDGLDPCFKVLANGDTCAAKCGISLHSPMNPETLAAYPVGYYSYPDNEVKNGFTYFYSVTAFDSVCTKFRTDGKCGTGPDSTLMTEGRKSAVEAEGVAPQAATMTGNQVWVVPNPYKGYSTLTDRPSTWDLTPNATDPTGTHIDFMGLPPGPWTIKIFTVSGDLVQELRSSDPVNESLRGPVTQGNATYPGYNRQQDTTNDGQASWNLISRNGQDIVSGVYLFTVDSDQGIQRGRFVVIR